LSQIPQRTVIDPLFRSTAQTHGERVIGVILTGNLDDVASGLPADNARERKHALIVRQFEQRFRELMRAARTIRSILLKTR
jgi:CheB methylesterase